MNTAVVYKAVGCTKSEWTSLRYKVKHLGTEIARFNAYAEHLQSMLKQICKAKDGGYDYSIVPVNLTTLNGDIIKGISVYDITLNSAEAPSYIAVWYFKDSDITPENIFEIE